MDAKIETVTTVDISQATIGLPEIIRLNLSLNGFPGSIFLPCICFLNKK